MVVPSGDVTWTKLIQDSTFLWLW